MSTRSSRWAGFFGWVVVGIFPLVVATGAGAGSRRAIGVATFSGMLAATAVGILLVPALYVLFQSLRERVSRHFRSNNHEQA